MLAFATWLSDSLFGILNALSGRSWFFDDIVSISMSNALVKAGPIGACFAYAWFAAAEPDELRRRRRVLLVSLASLVMVLAANRVIAKEIFLPRPFMMSQQVQLIQDDTLTARPKTQYHVPIAGEMKDRFEAMRGGQIIENDLHSFPSDHAAFFMTVALAILLACRIAGIIALTWTLFVIMLSRIVNGMHSPLDIACGAAISATILLAAQWIAGRWVRRPVDWLASWTMRNEGLSAAALALVLVEIVGTLDNTENFLRSGKGILERMIGA